MTDPNPHGHWLHLGDPNECGECYSRGMPAEQLEITIMSHPDINGQTEYVAFTWPTYLVLPPKIQARSPEIALVMAISGAQEEKILPFWPELKEPPLLENPFLDGPQKFEVMLALLAAAERTSLWPDSLNQISPRG